MDLTKIRELDIAKNKVDFIREKNLALDYAKWVTYINQHSDYFIWIENTQEGRETLAGIDSIPESFRLRILDGHNKKACNAEFDFQKKLYKIRVAFHPEYDRIRIDFEKPVTIGDLVRLLDMANYLDAYLLNNGNEIIDSKLIETLNKG